MFAITCLQVTLNCLSRVFFSLQLILKNGENENNSIQSEGIITELCCRITPLCLDHQTQLAITLVQLIWLKLFMNYKKTTLEGCGS